MSTFTSLGGMAPLVFMPGSGSELYRGLGSVVLGGLLVSTIFTIVLTPLLLSLVMDFQRHLRNRRSLPRTKGAPTRRALCTSEGASAAGIPAGATRSADA